MYPSFISLCKGFEIFNLSFSISYRLIPNHTGLYLTTSYPEQASIVLISIMTIDDFITNFEANLPLKYKIKPLPAHHKIQANLQHLHFVLCSRELTSKYPTEEVV